MRQQTRHAEGRIGRQHSKHPRECCIRPVGPVEGFGEFLGSLIAEGIADDDKGSVTLRFRQMRRYLVGVEILLSGQAIE